MLVFDCSSRLSHVLFGIVGMIMRLAPLGAFGAMAFTIGKYGLGTLANLGTAHGVLLRDLPLFIFIVLGAIARLHGFSIWKFIALHQGGAASSCSARRRPSRCCRG